MVAIDKHPAQRNRHCDKGNPKQREPKNSSTHCNIVLVGLFSKQFRWREGAINVQEWPRNVPDTSSWIQTLNSSDSQPMVLYRFVRATSNIDALRHSFSESTYPGALSIGPTLVAAKGIVSGDRLPGCPAEFPNLISPDTPIKSNERIPSRCISPVMAVLFRPDTALQAPNPMLMTASYMKLPPGTQLLHSVTIC